VLFGQPASLLDYGNGRYRVDVLVGDYTMEFDGEPFGSVDDFLATVGTARPTADAPAVDITAPTVEATLDADGMPQATGAATEAQAQVPPPTGPR
jgi:hypothetical protein